MSQNYCNSSKKIVFTCKQILRHWNVAVSGSCVLAIECINLHLKLNFCKIKFIGSVPYIQGCVSYISRQHVFKFYYPTIDGSPSTGFPVSGCMPVISAFQSEPTQCRQVSTWSGSQAFFISSNLYNND